MIYTLEQIKELVEPLAQKYKLNALCIFDSYARAEATDESDLNFLIDYIDTTIFNFFNFIDLESEFEQLFNKKIDLITTKALHTPSMEKYFSRFMNYITNKRVMIYEKL
jgi:predicted nucleotidyltransferase